MARGAQSDAVPLSEVGFRLFVRQPEHRIARPPFEAHELSMNCLNSSLLEFTGPGRFDAQKTRPRSTGISPPSTICATYVVRRSTTAFSRFNAAPAFPFV